jgi:hypothetical protein
MAKAKRKRIVIPKEDKQTVDGLGVSFEEAMIVLSNPINKHLPTPEK